MLFYMKDFLANLDTEELKEMMNSIDSSAADASKDTTTNELPETATIKKDRTYTAIPNTILKINPKLPRTPAITRFGPYPESRTRATLILNEESVDLDLGSKVVNLLGNTKSNLTNEEKEEALKTLEDFQKRVTLAIDMLKSD